MTMLMDLSKHKKLDIAIFEDCIVRELTVQISSWLKGAEDNGWTIVAASPALPTGEDPTTISFIVTIYYSRDRNA